MSLRNPVTFRAGLGRGGSLLLRSHANQSPDAFNRSPHLLVVGGVGLLSELVCISDCGAGPSDGRG